MLPPSVHSIKPLFPAVPEKKAAQPPESSLPERHTPPPVSAPRLKRSPSDRWGIDYEEYDACFREITDPEERLEFARQGILRLKGEEDTPSGLCIPWSLLVLIFQNISGICGQPGFICHLQQFCKSGLREIPFLQKEGGGRHALHYLYEALRPENSFQPGGGEKRGRVPGIFGGKVSL